MQIIIIGAGPSGLTAALRLSQVNEIQAVVYELREKHTTLQGGAIGIPCNGLRLLHRLGVYQEIAALGAPTRSLVLHSSKGSLIGELDLVQWSEKKTGFGYMRIKREELMAILVSAVHSAGIEIHYGKSLERVQENGSQVGVYFSDGTIDVGDLLLGCDGIHSAVRTKYVDPTCAPIYTGISNIGSILSTSNLPSSIMKIRTLNATFTEDGVLVLIPANARRDSIYWFFSREVAIPKGDTRDGWEERNLQRVEQMKGDLVKLLGSADNAWSNLLKEVLRKTEVIKFYPNYTLPPGGRWRRGRVLLLGDAAHAIPPHASQGFSMALEDVFLFCNLLRQDYSSIETIFVAYEKARRRRLKQVLDLSESRSDARKSIPKWRLQLRESVLTSALKLYKVLGLQKLGLGQKLSIYDVEEEALLPMDHHE